jgi:hypothetical protein
MPFVRLFDRGNNDCVVDHEIGILLRRFDANPNQLSIADKLEVSPARPAA